MDKFTLEDFMVESNRIEGITREDAALTREVAAAEVFLSHSKLHLSDFEALNKVLQPGALLRDKPGMNVRVGSHLPERGGPDIATQIKDLIEIGNDHRHSSRSAHWLHVQYENLHPFMDGNGRTGRLFWLWLMGGIEKAPLGFLHTFYYQTLEASDGR